MFGNKYTDVTIVAAIALCFALHTTAQAQLSPGDLAEAHSELEGITNCTSCHELGEGPSAQKCLNCHSEIKERLDSRSGYHYRVVEAEGQACFACHSDHGGKDFALIHWEDGEASFRHELTGYELTGKHVKLECRQCHRPDFISTQFVGDHPNVNLGSTHLGLQEDCLNCHRDEHRAQLGTDCLKCHTTEAWKPAEKFSHENTKYPLRGAHKQVLCDKCHLSAQPQPVISPAGVTDDRHTNYTDLDYANCTPCHSDPHRNSLGDNCRSCHDYNAWRPAKGFDHNKTKFPLTGKHIEVECLKCHKNVSEIETVAHQDNPLAKFAGLNSDNCSACHKDAHANQLGSDCKSCHNATGWKDITNGSFDHAKTAFPLIGLHQKVECAKCHRKQETKNKVIKVAKPEHERCDNCHGDIHRGQFTDRQDGGICESCHNENSFTPALFSIDDHARTKFPLSGAHLAQPCITCHTYAQTKKGKKYRIFDLASEKCEQCHNDPHAAQFVSSDPVKQCKDCHTDDSWAALRFDHNSDSRYRLEGAHARTECGGCHKAEHIGGKQNTMAIRYRPVGMECRDCHSLKTLELLGSR